MYDSKNICLELSDTIFIDNPISPPIYQTSSFHFKDFNQYISVNTKQQSIYTYSRDGNPTTQLLEEKLARLEHGQACKSFSSGMAAISGTILSLVKQNEHIVVVNTVYSSTLSFIKQLSKFGISYTLVQSLQSKEVINAINDNTKLIYMESPSSQKFEMLDFDELVSFCTENNVYTAIDNTWASPLFFNPIDYGIDIVIHSCSKFIGGHSDVVAGVVISTQKIIESIDHFAGIYLGGTLSPHSAWLLTRGLRTLDCRMERVDKNSRIVLEYLKASPYVERIYHPFIQQPDIASKYLKGSSSLFGFVLKDATLDIIQTFIDNLQLFTLAYSWGGFESLVIPAFKGNNQEEMKQRGLSFGHIRMYVGLEDASSLVNDLDQALHCAYNKR